MTSVCEVWANNDLRKYIMAERANIKFRALVHHIQPPRRAKDSKTTQGMPQGSVRCHRVVVDRRCTENVRLNAVRHGRAMCTKCHWALFDEVPYTVPGGDMRDLYIHKHNANVFWVGGASTHGVRLF